MDREALARWRSRSVGLRSPRFDSPESVVRHLVAVQSQEYGPAKWSLGQRGGAASDAEVDAALDSGRILRTHVLRPTWHFVLPEDIRWMLALTGPRILRTIETYFRKEDPTPGLIDRAVRLMEGELGGGNHLTRAELRSLLASHGLEMSAMQMGFLTACAELEAVVCSGARKVGQQTYALLDERAPQRTFDRDRALRELTLRYFSGHGPATVKDFRWWSGLTAADARTGIESAGSELLSEEFDGLTYLFAERTVPRPASRPKVHLLQPYDEYIVGYTESRNLMDLSGQARSWWRGGALYPSVLLVDTQIAGSWKRTVKKEASTISVDLDRPLSREERTALDRAVRSHGDFLSLTATLEVTG